jgi:tetratricopeptide (TPR) repeat protein
MIRFLIILLFPFFTFGQSLVKEIEGFINNKEYTKAEKGLFNYNNTPSKDIRTIEVIGDAYAQKKQWEKAVFIFEYLIKVDAKNANYHYKYGEALGRYALMNNKIFALFTMNEVKREFLLAAKLDTTHINARWALVVFYTELPGIFGGSIRKALSYTEELQILSPIDGYLSKGYVYEYDNEIDLAEKNYKKAINVGGSITCFNKLISFYKSNNEPKMAISTIEEAYKKLQLNSLNYRIGEVSVEFEVELDKGKNGLIKYIENYSSADNYTVEWANLRLAQIYKLERDKRNALKWINKALELESNFEPALKEKALILNI